MDNLTHTVTGLMLARTGLNRLSPYATAVLILSANCPDVDIVSLTGGQGTFFHYHRGITHALVMAPVLAAVVVAGLALFRSLWLRISAEPGKLSPPVQAHRLYWLALAGVASHLLLDFTNAYGIRLLAPWSEDWLALNITSVVDIWIWAAILLSAGAPFLSHLVSSEIGAGRTKGRGWAIFFLVFLVVFDTGRFMLSRRAIAVQEGRLYSGLAPRRVLIFPDPVNPFRWRGFVETETFWVVQDVNLHTDFDPASGQIYYKPESSRAIEAAQAAPALQDLLAFSKAPLWRVVPAPEPDGGTIVKAVDLRFGSIADDEWVATAILDRNGRVQRSWFQFRP